MGGKLTNKQNSSSPKIKSCPGWDSRNHDTLQFRRMSKIPLTSKKGKCAHLFLLEVVNLKICEILAKMAQRLRTHHYRLIINESYLHDELTRQIFSRQSKQQKNRFQCQQLLLAVYYTVLRSRPTFEPTQLYTPLNCHQISHWLARYTMWQVNEV